MHNGNRRQTKIASNQNPLIAIQLAFKSISANTPDLTALRISEGANDFKAARRGFPIMKTKEAINGTAKI